MFDTCTVVKNDQNKLTKLNYLFIYWFIYFEKQPKKVRVWNYSPGINLLKRPGQKKPRLLSAVSSRRHSNQWAWHAARTLLRPPSSRAWGAPPSSSLVHFCCCAARNGPNWIRAFIFSSSLGSRLFLFFSLQIEKAADRMAITLAGINLSQVCTAPPRRGIITHFAALFIPCVYATFYSWSPGCPEPSSVPLFAEKSSEGKIRKNKKNNDAENKVRLFNTGRVFGLKKKGKKNLTVTLIQTNSRKALLELRHAQRSSSPED